jgi:outer membrane lipoprotein-sorting protein
VRWALADRGDTKEAVTRLRRLPGSLVAAIVVLVVVATAAIGITKVRAQPAPNLPDVTAEQLVASSIAALGVPHAVSGDVRTRLDVGLPEIPASLSAPAGQLGVTSVLGALVGTQRFRVWSSPDGIRVQHLMDLQEQDLVANPSQAWFWDSATATATKLRAAGVTSVLPAPPTNDPSQIANADPMVLAKHLLALASTCGAVTVGDPAVIAGRDAYVVHFTPASGHTLVGDVAIAIDAQTRLPLDVSVTPRGASAPALEAGFTSVSFGPIDPSMFAFTPPADATVRDVTGRVATAVASAAGHKDMAPGGPRPVTDGTCLDTSVAVPLGEPLPPEVTALLPYSGSLVSVIEAERAGKSWLLAGPVDTATLQARAAALP